MGRNYPGRKHKSMSVTFYIDFCFSKGNTVKSKKKTLIPLNTIDFLFVCLFVFNRSRLNEHIFKKVNPAMWNLVQAPDCPPGADFGYAWLKGTSLSSRIFQDVAFATQCEAEPGCACRWRGCLLHPGQTQPACKAARPKPESRREHPGKIPPAPVALLSRT